MRAMRVVIDGKDKVIIVEDRKCVICGKDFQPLKMKSFCCSRQCRRKLSYKRNKEIENSYKDKYRHGGKRKELIQNTGLVCTECGKSGNSFQIVAHHVTGNNQDHSQQVLLCRACHCRLHQSVPKKHVTKEQIEMAIKSTKNLDEACNVLGINRSSLYWKRKKFGMQFSELYKHNLTR